MSKIYKANKILFDGSAIIENESEKYVNLNNVEEYEEGLEVDEEIDIEQLRKQAKAIISNAEQQAKNIVEVAREEAEIEAKTIKEDAYNKGYEEGYETGKSDGYTFSINENEALKLENEKILQDTIEEKERTLESIEGEVVEVISSITSDILDTAFAVDDMAILMLVKRGLSKAMILEKVTVKVNDTDYLTVAANIDELKKVIDSSKTIEIIKDFNLVEGDCILETEYGYMNCSLSGLKSSLYNNLALIYKSRT